MQNQYYSKDLDSLAGEWDDECPFELSYEKYSNMKQLPHFNIADGENYKQISSDVIKLYKNDQTILQIVKNPIWPEFNYKILAHWQISNFYYLVILLHQENELYFYRINKQSQYQLLLNIKNDNPIFQIFNERSYPELALKQHKLGFFVNFTEKMCQISNQTLKQISQFKINGFNQKDKIQYYDCFKQILIIGKLLLLEVFEGKSTIMANQNGRMIRRIEGYEWNSPRKELFLHFLIITSQSPVSLNPLYIYDLKKGRYVAKIYICPMKCYFPPYIQNNYLTVYIDYKAVEVGWKLKKKYQIE